MATEKIDGLTARAPPAKRICLENNMESTKSPAATDKMDLTMASSEIPGLGRLNIASANVPPGSSDSKSQPAMEKPPVAIESTSNIGSPTLHDSRTQPAPPYLDKESPAFTPSADHVLLSSNDSDNLPVAPKESQPPFKQDSDLDVPEPPSVTHALEALLGGLDSATAEESENPPVAQEEPPADEHPEWEVDSSPIESSSEDSSSDDSSSEEDSEDEDSAYKLLSPEEQARILMEGDGGSDDEGGATTAKGSAGQLRTKNEIPEEVISKPDVTVTTEMRIEDLGVVETIVENTILIKAKTSGEYRVLESGSVICLEDRSVIGVVSETLGRVQQPLYTVRFTNAGEILEAGMSIGTKVFYSEHHAKYALTQVLKAYKGSDASNLHDEEVGDEEIEFSDDEAEAEHKRRLKQKKLEKRGGKVQQNGGSSRGGHPLQQQYSPPNGVGGLSYDDEDDGPYKPLTRPTGFADTVGRSEAPQEGAYVPGISNRGGRGDFRGRGRGDRGRGRGDRGRGRGGHQDRRDSNGYSHQPQGRQNSSYGASQQGPTSQALPSFNLQQGAGFPQFSTVSTNNQYNHYNPQQPPVFPPFPPQQFQQFQQAFQGFPNTQNGWPNIPQPPSLPAGAFINPTFFASGQPDSLATQNQWGHQQRQQGGRGRGGSS